MTKAPARRLATRAKPTKGPSRRTAKPVATRAGKAGGLSGLPEWDLTDLYTSLDAPEVKRDLERCDADSIAFEHDFKGKLADLVSQPDGGARLADAIRRYEAIEELMGRILSYAGLAYAGNTVDPVIAKFYADAQERITTSSLHLLFFALELNRIEDATLELAMRDPALAHYRPWIEDIRKEKPYQLDDRLEQLFHEKSVTGYSAWNRLFDETIA
ncbi:MAG: oligoendopeptidase F, partial [Pseudorhodoplanes sp.]